MPYVFLQNVGKWYARSTRLAGVLWANHAGKPLARKEGDFQALVDVSLSVGSGEAVGIIGQNGSGKTTLMSIISGKLTPSTGEIRTEGRIISVFDFNSGLDPNLSGVDNIFLKGLYYGATRAELLQKFDDIVAFSGLGEFVSQPLRTYSTGMRLRLAFSLIVHLDFDILLLDEVFAVGDLRFQRACHAALRQHLAAGKILFLISHSLDELAAICTRMVLLRNGCLVRDGQPDGIIKEYWEKREETLALTSYKGLASQGATGQWLPKGEAQITDIQLRGADGKATGVFTAGEAVRIDVTYTKQRDLVGLLIRLHLHRSDGLWVWGNNSARMGLALDLAAGPGKVVVEIPSLNLLSSYYYLSVSLWPDEFESLAAKTPYDIKEFSIELQVVDSRAAGAGLLYMPATFTEEGR